MLAAANPLEHVVAHPIFEVFGVVVNNHMIMATVAAGLTMAILVPVLRVRQVVPSGLRNAVESVCTYFRDEVARPFLHDHTDRFIPFIWTLFFFILFCNLLGVIPVASIVYLISGGTLKEVGGTATGNIYVTGALAAFTFVMIHVSGIWSKIAQQRGKGRSLVAAGIIGFFMYWYKMVPHIGGVAGVVLFVPLLALEILGVMVKSVALAIRLFANMVGGHTVLAVLLGFIAMGKTLVAGMLVAWATVAGVVAMSLLELFVAFLQAYIFAFLATLFIGMAVHQDH